MDIAELIRRRISEGRRISDGDALDAANEVTRLRGLLASTLPAVPTQEMLVAGQDALDECIDEDYDSDADGIRHYFQTIRSDAAYRVWAAMAEAFRKS